MIQRNLQSVCKPLHLSYIIDHYNEISFETKEQFLRDIFNIEIKSLQTKKGANKFICHLQRVKSTFVNCDFLKGNKTFYYSNFLKLGKRV